MTLAERQQETRDRQATKAKARRDRQDRKAQFDAAAYARLLAHSHKLAAIARAKAKADYKKAKAKKVRRERKLEQQRVCKLYGQGSRDYNRLKPWPKAILARMAEWLTANYQEQQQPINTRDWQEVLYVHGFACACCGKSGPLHIDHIVPRQTGGTNAYPNLQPLCGPCNISKSARTRTYVCSCGRVVVDPRDRMLPPNYAQEVPNVTA